MKKGLICLVLAFLMVVPVVLTGCQKEADFTETAANVYTLYTIVDESTTKEAITKVELALNRILFYRLGVCLKLVTVTEDEYEELIENQFETMEAYQAAKKDKTKTSSEEPAEETSEVVLSGDRILEMLENGEEIELKNPRMDIFLVRGYDKYYEYATNEKLAAIDEKLNNEAKALKYYIHSTLFNAAKVGNKTYGIPVNNAIGKYSYLVFDKELLDKYSVDPNTIKSLEDLEEYLSQIKANEPNIIPLKESHPSASINYLCNDGTPFVVTNVGEVVDAYSNKEVTAFYTLLAKFNTLGYFENDGTEEARYAVRIEDGSKDELVALHKDEEYELEYSLFANPVAVNENTIDNIFCISKYVVSNELTDVMKIITALNTDSELMDILTYGVENEHYRVVNDNGQIERLNNNPENIYLIKPEYAGNAFITRTLVTDPEDKWSNAIQQNQDAIPSKALGFTLVLNEYTVKYKETITDDDGNEQEIEKEAIVTEPDYLAIINTIVDKYYPALMSGTAVEINYDEIIANANAEVKESLIEKLDNLYQINILDPMFKSKIKNQVIAEKSKAFRTEAEQSILEFYYDDSDVINAFTEILTAKFKAENADISDEDLAAKIEETLTEDYIKANIKAEISKKDYPIFEEIYDFIEEMFNRLIDEEVETRNYAAQDSAAYKSEFERLRHSEKYKQDLNDMLKYDAPAEVEKKFNALVAEKIKVYTDNMKAEMEEAIKVAVEEFAERYEELGFTSKEELLADIGYLEEDVAEDGEAEEGENKAKAEEAKEETSKEEGEEGEEGEETKKYKVKYDSYFDFVFNAKFAQPYYKIFGTPNGN